VISIPPPAPIERLASEVARPFWSVMIPVYNGREDYLRETLMSVLLQDPGREEMQIEVIDNCSTAFDPQALVLDTGGGRIAFHRQPENVGIVGNFNTCIARARGRWVHILHADDTVRPGFYSQARAGIERHTEAGAAMCRTIFMDGEGQWTGFAELEARVPGILDAGFAAREFVEQRIFFASFVVRRTTYEELGGFRATLPHCLDWDMWKRITARKPIYYDPAPMACYRIHGEADSSVLFESGRNVVDERRSIEYSCAEMASADASRLRSAAKKALGIRAVRRAVLLRKHGRRMAARRQLIEGLRTSHAPAVLLRAALFLVGLVLRAREEAPLS
jgi:GT2 family glycosyltransferase